MFEDKRVLVTGGTGSLGRQIVLYLLACGATEVRVFSRDQGRQQRMADELKTDSCGSKDGTVSFVAGDVRDAKALARATRDIDIVFHTAALKHVPICEQHVMKAVATNVLGSSNVIRAALQNGVDRVLAISTDKAVRPVSVMGITKALQEQLFIEAAAHAAGAGTVFCTMRAGNLLGSSGSVVPLFKQQIEAGGPVTVTCPSATRFVMTVEEAVTLACDAVHWAVGGEILVPRLPAFRIGMLAQVMIQALAAGEDIKVTEIGLRPGERLHEVLVSDTERGGTIWHEPFFVILPELDLPETRDHYREAPAVDLGPDGEWSSRTAPLLTSAELRSKLRQGRCLP